MDDELRGLLDEVREMRAEIRALKGNPHAATFGDVFERYLKHNARERWANHVRSLMQHVVAALGPKRMEELGMEAWEAYVEAQMARTTNRGKAPAASSLNVQLQRLKTIVRWGFKRGISPQAPVLMARPLKQRPGRETEIHPDGDARLLEVFNPVMRALYLVAVSSMARATEVRTLTWQQLDLDRGRVTLYWWRAKTKKARVTRISKAAVDALRALPRHVSSPYVFANPMTGRPYSTSRVWEWWRAGCADAGIVPDDPEDENVHLHDARGTGMSRLARLNVPIPTILKMSGHRSLARAQRYLHANEDDLDAAKAAIDEAHRRGPQRTDEPAGNHDEAKRKT